MSTIKIRTKPQTSGYLLRILISHPMETGRRRDTDGSLIPAHYIETVTIEHNGKIIVSSQFGMGISRDPYLAFRLPTAQAGDSIRVAWVDNLGQRDSETVLITALAH